MKKLILFSFLVFVLVPPFLFAGDCKEYVELYSARDIANEQEECPMWVKANVRINLYTPCGAKVLGSMEPGSRSLIIEVGENDYKVKNPHDDSIGWINKKHVKRTIWLDLVTGELCEPEPSKPESSKP